VTRAIGVGVFAAISVVGAAIDLLNRRRTSQGPNVTQALDWLQARSVGQIAVFAMWAFSGWHFFVR
jgi:hypothetical protein